MDDFVALDLETANRDFASICEIGLVRYRKGVQVESWSHLISPSAELFYFENTWIHGINEEDCIDAPEFPEVTDSILNFLDGAPLVAHNTGFDMAAIRRVFNLYGIPYPPMTYFCTLVLARKALKGELVSFRLQNVADYLGVDFDQIHRAESDARAAGDVAVSLMKRTNVESLNQLAEAWDVRAGSIDGDIDLRCQSIQVSPAYKKLSAEERERLADLQRKVWGVEDLDPSRDFYGKNVVMTGALQSMTRQQSKAVLESIGAIPTASVSGKTDFIVLGEQKLEEIEAGGSRKEKMAKELLDSGAEIEVIEEAEFVRLLLS